MSLADLAKSLQDFDPKKDNINQSNNNGLPAGEYEVLIEDASHKTFQSGWDCIGFDFSVLTGEFAGRKEIVNLSFAETSKSGKNIPEFVLERNGRTVMALGALMGVTVPVSVFLMDNETDIHEKLGQMLHSEIGETVKMIIKTRPNKNDPDNPYKEYEFKASEQSIETPDVDDSAMPFADSENQIEISDDELPFD